MEYVYYNHCLCLTGLVVLPSQALHCMEEVSQLQLPQLQQLLIPLNLLLLAPQLAARQGQEPRCRPITSSSYTRPRLLMHR